MERPHEYAPIEWVELTEDKISLSSLSGMNEVESDSKGTCLLYTSPSPRD